MFMKIYLLILLATSLTSGNPVGPISSDGQDPEGIEQSIHHVDTTLKRTKNQLPSESNELFDELKTRKDAEDSKNAEFQKQAVQMTHEETATRHTKWNAWHLKEQLTRENKKVQQTLKQRYRKTKSEIQEILHDLKHDCERLIRNRRNSKNDIQQKFKDLRKEANDFLLQKKKDVQLNVEVFTEQAKQAVDDGEAELKEFRVKYDQLKQVAKTTFKDASCELKKKIRTWKEELKETYRSA